MSANRISLAQAMNGPFRFMKNLYIMRRLQFSAALVPFELSGRNYLKKGNRQWPLPPSDVE
jgi:hypothetical protein